MSKKKLDHDEKEKIANMLKQKNQNEVFDPLKFLAKCLQDNTRINIQNEEIEIKKPKKKFVEIVEEKNTEIDDILSQYTKIN